MVVAKVVVLKTSPIASNRKTQISKTGGINELLADYDWQFAKYINIDLAMPICHSPSLSLRPPLLSTQLTATKWSAFWHDANSFLLLFIFLRPRFESKIASQWSSQCEFSWAIFLPRISLPVMVMLIINKNCVFPLLRFCLLLYSKIPFENY